MADDEKLLEAVAETLELHANALGVLKTMLKAARLGKGANVAADMIKANATLLAAINARLGRQPDGR